MLDNGKFSDSVDFVARHYRHGAFSVSHAWRQCHVRPWWKPTRAVAAVGACVFLIASACVYTWIVPEFGQSGPDSVQVDRVDHSVPSVHGVVKIEFNDESLAVVVAEIERVYGVKVLNVPEREYRVTLSYEGTASDLIDTLNELLGTDMQIRQ